MAFPRFHGLFPIALDAFFVMRSLSYSMFYGEKIALSIKDVLSLCIATRALLLWWFGTCTAILVVLLGQSHFYAEWCGMWSKVISILQNWFSPKSHVKCILYLYPLCSKHQYGYQQPSNVALITYIKQAFEKCTSHYQQIHSVRLFKNTILDRRSSCYSYWNNAMV